jgi:hypothetical protein
MAAVPKELVAASASSVALSLALILGFRTGGDSSGSMSRPALCSVKGRAIDIIGNGILEGPQIWPLVLQVLQSLSG